MHTEKLTIPSPEFKPLGLLVHKDCLVLVEAHQLGPLSQQRNSWAWCRVVAAAGKSRGCSDCGRGRCEIHAISRPTVTPKSHDCGSCAAGEAEQPCDVCNGIFASPLAAALVAGILPCELCGAKFLGHLDNNLKSFEVL